MKFDKVIPYAVSHEILRFKKRPSPVWNPCSSRLRSCIPFCLIFQKGEKPFCVWFFKIAPPLQCKTPCGIHDLVPGAYCFIMKNDQMTKWPPSSISWDPEIWDMACRNEKLHSKNSGLPPVLHWKRAHWLVFRAFRTSIVRTNPSWRMNTKTLDTRH